ncbi:MAG: ASCH domain-containing protein [Dissulfurispiraceae bacterium]
MKTLSLYNPWAMLMALGLKTNETRSWATKYRGPLAIHASKKNVEASFPDEFVEHVTEAIEAAGISVGDIPRLPKGGIIGIVDLKDCIEITEDNKPDYPERYFGDYTPGRFMWITDNARAFKKIIPMRGYQGLFNVDDDALRVCRVCGCSELNACEGGCYWIVDDLCSACCIWKDGRFIEMGELVDCENCLDPLNDEKCEKCADETHIIMSQLQGKERPEIKDNATQIALPMGEI